jgi:hypothetical protein
MTLEKLAEVTRAHARALKRAAELGDQRAISAYRAKSAGAYAQLSEVLGTARPNVVTLVRRGEALLGVACASGVSVPEPELREVEARDVPVGSGRACIKPGCSNMAVLGQVTCERHLTW